MKVSDADLYLGATELIEQVVRLIPKPAGKMQSTKALTFLLSALMYAYLAEHEPDTNENDRHFLMCHCVIYACMQMYIMRLKDHNDLARQKIILQITREFMETVLDSTGKVMEEGYAMPLNLPGNHADWKARLHEEETNV